MNIVYYNYILVSMENYNVTVKPQLLKFFNHISNIETK